MWCCFWGWFATMTAQPARSVPYKRSSTQRIRSRCAELERVVKGVEQDFPECRLAAHHRTGPLAIGDLAVVVAAAAPHRGEAFAAARRLIDDLKSQVPIWKHQSFIDGSEEWVGLP